MSEAHYQITFYVPLEDCEKVKQAMFEAGAGKLGDYQECAWQTEGQGQFRPLSGSQPHIGQQNTLEYVKEFKVEMICHQDKLNAAIEALKAGHPYEEAAYFVVKNEM